MKRISSKRRTRNTQGRTNLIGILTLVAVLSGILLFFTNERQNEQVLTSYCGDFGFYNKKLTLMKNGTFKFIYYGCSQSNGHIDGEWTTGKDVLMITPSTPDDILDTKYKIVNSELFPVNLDNEKFILCEDYEYGFWSTYR